MPAPMVFFSTNTLHHRYRPCSLKGETFRKTVALFLVTTHAVSTVEEPFLVGVADRAQSGPPLDGGGGMLAPGNTGFGL